MDAKEGIELKFTTRPPEGRRLFTVRELACYIGSTEGTVYTWSCTRKIPPACIIRLGRSLRFDILQINKWLDAQQGRA